MIHQEGTKYSRGYQSVQAKTRQRPSRQPTAHNVVSGTHPPSQTTVFLNAVKDPRLPLGFAQRHCFRVVHNSTETSDHYGLPSWGKGMRPLMAHVFPSSRTADVRLQLGHESLVVIEL